MRYMMMQNRLQSPTTNCHFLALKRKQNQAVLESPGGGGDGTRGLQGTGRDGLRALREALFLY